jgi:hypothetical protein
MTLSRKVLSAVATVVMVASYPIGAFADSVSGKTNSKTASSLDARAFFFQVRPVRPAPAAHVSTVAATSTTSSPYVAMGPCVGCQPLIVVGVGF